MVKNQDTTVEAKETEKPVKATNTNRGRRGANNSNNKKPGPLPMGLAEMIDKENNDRNEELFMRMIEGEDDTRRFIVIEQFGKLFKQEKPRVIFDVLENERKVGLYDFSVKYTPEDEKHINTAMNTFVTNRTKLFEMDRKKVTIGTIVKAFLFMPETYMKVIKYLEDCSISSEWVVKEEVEYDTIIGVITDEARMFAQWEKYLNDDDTAECDKEAFKESREDALKSLYDYFKREYVA